MVDMCMGMSMCLFKAVGIAAIVAVAIGWLWHSPMFFGDMMKKAGGKKPKGDMKQLVVFEFLLSCIVAYVLAGFLSKLGAVGNVQKGMMIAIYAWFGFVVPLRLHSVVWGGKTMQMCMLCLGYSLVSFAAMGAVLAYLM